MRSGARNQGWELRIGLFNVLFWVPDVCCLEGWCVGDGKVEWGGGQDVERSAENSNCTCHFHQKEH